MIHHYTNGSTFNYYAGAACYDESTDVLCVRDGVEAYVNIQKLTTDDYVKTHKNGVKRVKMIGSYNMLNDVKSLVNCMYTNSKGLMITAAHSVLVDEKDRCDSSAPGKSCYKTLPMIEDKYMLLARDSCDFTKVEDVNKIFKVYHLVLEGSEPQYGIYVTGDVLSETICEAKFKEMNFQ